MRPNRQHRKPPDIDRAGNGSSGFRAGHYARVHLRDSLAGCCCGCCCPTAAAGPTPGSRTSSPGPVPGASGRVEEEQMGFFAHLRSDRAAVTSRRLGVCPPVASGVGGRVAAHPGPDDEGTGIRLLPGLGVLRAAGHHRTRSFRCASRSSTNRATATFPECGRSSCLPRWRGWACGAGPRHT